MAILITEKFVKPCSRTFLLNKNKLNREKAKIFNYTKLFLNIKTYNTFAKQQVFCSKWGLRSPTT